MTSASGNSKAEAAALAQARLSGSCVAQPVGESAHHRNGEERRLMHKKKESLFGNRGDSQAVLALAVAARGAPSISAISPKIPPGPSFSTTLPSSISTSPERMTYILSPLSPAVKMVSPGL